MKLLRRKPELKSSTIRIDGGEGGPNPIGRSVLYPGATLIYTHELTLTWHDIAGNSEDELLNRLAVIFNRRLAEIRDQVIRPTQDANGRQP